MKKITWEELLAMFDAEVHDHLKKIVGRDDVTGMVVFENHDMWSSQLGEKTAVIVGPGCTYKSVDVTKGKWLNDLPSMRQYPISYYEKEQE